MNKFRSKRIKLALAEMYKTARVFELSPEELSAIAGILMSNSSAALVLDLEDSHENN